VYLANIKKNFFVGLSRFGCKVFFFLYPLLEAAFQYAPLSADLKCRDLPVLDHAVQGSLGYFKYAGSFRESKQLDRGIGFFHGGGTPAERISEQVICHHPNRD
jgi:hypothetical protein